MRKIKFRAWNGSAMKYGGFSIHATGKTQPIDSSITSVTKKSPIMQFTGLLDKNGTEIYEGDILFCAHEKYHGEVSFMGGYFGTNARGWGIEPLHEFVEQFEVVGNIHENHELLEA